MNKEISIVVKITSNQYFKYVLTGILYIKMEITSTIVNGNCYLIVILWFTPRFTDI